VNKMIILIEGNLHANEKELVFDENSESNENIISFHQTCLRAYKLRS